MDSLLYITAFPPNHNSGGQVFSLNVLNELSKKFIISLIYFTYPDHKCEYNNGNIIGCYSPSLMNCFNKIIYYPLFTKRFNKDLLLKLKNIAPQYDILYFDYAQVAVYSLYITHPYKVIRCHDIMVQKFSRTSTWLLPWIKWSEKQILASATKVFVPSEKDAILVQDTYDISTIFTNEYLANFSIPAVIPDDTTFIFFGLWSRKENLNGLVWFIENVYPLIDSKFQNKFSVMGAGLADEYRLKYLSPKNIDYLGFVENSYDVIVKAAAMIVPLFEGAGIKIKVLDAFTTGTPVIGTSVAFEGIPTIDGLTFEANSAQIFASTINSFRALSVFDKQQKQKKFFSLYDKNHLGDLL